MKNWKIILASVFLCCIIISCGDKKTEDDAEQTEQVEEQQTTQEQLEAEKQKAIEDSLQAAAEKSAAAKKTVEDEQYSKPKKFMKAENVSFASRGLLSNNLDIKYTVVNVSSSVSYKNVAFRVEYLDADNKVLATKDLKHDEIFAPRKRKDIETMVDKVKGTEKIRIICINATAVR